MSTPHGWIVEPPPPYRVEPLIVTDEQTEKRVFAIVRSNGERIATTPHGDVAKLILQALTRRPQ